MPHPRITTVSFALLPAAAAASAALLACGAHEALQPPKVTPAPVAEQPPTPHLEPAAGDGRGSTIALASLGARRVALVADSDAHAIRVFDRDDRQELEPTYLQGEPSQLLVLDDGRVLAAMRDRAEVDVLSATPGLSFRLARRVPTAAEPVSLALTPDRKSLLIATGWGHTLDVFATSSFERRFQADLPREPRAVVANADGTKAYVAHAGASGLTLVDLQSPDHPTEFVDLSGRDFNNNRPLAWRQGFSLVSTDVGIVAPGMVTSTGDTTERPTTYGGESGIPAQTFNVALVDGPASAPGPQAAHPVARIASNVLCFLPRAAAYDPLGNAVFVVCQGVDRLFSINAPQGHSVGWNVAPEPTGVALDRETRTALVWSQLSRTITSVPMDGTADAELTYDEIGDTVYADDPVRVGRALFSKADDPRISADGRACATCHPEGRDDGLVWSTPDGPRQTPTLAGRLAGTAPYGWNGARNTVFKHITGTLKRLGGTGLDRDSMRAVVAYCMTMKSAPKAEPQGTPLVAEGRALFESASVGCSSCHIQDGTFTDGDRHDVKSKAAGDPRKDFDTPSLRFVSGTAPYFHDGRFPSLRALLLASGGDRPDDVAMGHSAQLSDHEIDALEAYLRTL
jgi:DNA-binding beta-propeller fold protein YncE/mono/diheme cytochrome c family protein